jgi:CDP-diacylglycerol--glycerol-3-phosphate 3-phosphatidyltransferase
MFLLVQAVTLVRIPLCIAVAAILLGRDLQFAFSPTLCLLLGLLVIAELTDFFDGWLARRLDVVSETGAMLDPFSDSISRLIVYWAFAIAGLILPIVPLGMAIRDITVAYCRIMLAQKGRSVAAQWSGKVKAWVQGIGAFAALLGPVYWETTGKGAMIALSWIVFLLTMASIGPYARSAMEGEARNSEL